VTAYVDSSALLKLYLEEPDSEYAENLLIGAGDWLTGRHTTVEVRRSLTRHLDGQELAAAQRQFQRDLENISIVELTTEVCEVAAQLAEATGIRTLDALHMGAAKVAGQGSLPLITFDLRQAQAAHALGWIVLGS
jgi:predicted nucleic acid-binding protein